MYDDQREPEWSQTKAAAPIAEYVNEPCPTGEHRHIDPDTGRAYEKVTVGNHNDEEPEIPTGEYTPTWTDEVFDLLQEGIDAARGAALHAAENNDPVEWARATQAIGTYRTSIDRVGEAFGAHAMELEVQSSGFLQALIAHLSNQGIEVHTVVD